MSRTPLDEAAFLLGDLARRDEPLGPLTTYRVGGPAALYVELGDEGALEKLAGAVARTGLPVLVVGKGSNLLVCDAGFPGLAVRLGEGFSGLAFEDEVAVAGGALAYPVLARRSAAAGLSGMEWAVGIPGSVGGAVRMNAGGHGAETKDTLLAARLVDLAADGEPRQVAAEELGLSYRHSAVRESEIVLAARFRLIPGDPEASSRRLAEIVRWRRENQPGGQNAGSVFTNPPGDSAGRLVDSVGLKGYRIGTAAVSEKHANFIQADSGGSADDVRRLIDAVREKVAAETGVELAVEVRWIGPTR